jgi:hypothetical protein
MAMEFPLPLPDDPPSYVEAWIRWQLTVHQASPAQVADILTRAHVPSWVSEDWTRDTIAQLVARPLDTINNQERSQA